MYRKEDRPTPGGYARESDVLHCPASESTLDITRRRARDDHHSFGGKMPPEPEPHQLSTDEDGLSTYFAKYYIRAKNAPTCDGCGHRCLN